jgi:hypothetical protein
MAKIHNPRHGKWKFELNFTFQNDETLKTSQMGKKAAAEIEALVKLPDIKKNLAEDILCELMLIAKGFAKVRSDNSYNGCLEALYDMSDRFCIWVAI